MQSDGTIFVGEVVSGQFQRLGSHREDVSRGKGLAHEPVHGFGCAGNFLIDEHRRNETEAPRFHLPPQRPRVRHELDIEIAADHRGIEVERQHVHRRMFGESIGGGRDANSI